MNSIFGSAAPKFVYDPGGENPVTVLLNFWVTTTEETEQKEIVHDSELSAERSIIPLGDYLRFEGRVHLFKYGTMAQISSKFNEIYTYDKASVAVWKHRDGEPFKDAAGNPILFQLNVTPKNLYSLDYRDVLLLSFRALKGVDYSNSEPSYPSSSEIIMSNYY